MVQLSATSVGIAEWFVEGVDGGIGVLINVLPHQHRAYYGLQGTSQLIPFNNILGPISFLRRSESIVADLLR